MEVSIVEEPNVPKSSCSLIKLRSIELVVADDEREADQCKHFTIRGYVSEARKKDAKLCWPFLMLHNHSSYEYANSLPPLSVTKFKWWDCHNCRGKTISPEPVIVNTRNVEVRSDDCLLLRNANVASHPDATKLFSGFRRPSEETTPDERSTEADSFVDVSSGECRPSLHCGKKEDESAIRETKEGFHVSRDGHDKSEGNQQQSNESTSTATEGETYKTGGRGEGNIDADANTSKTGHHGKDDSKKISAEQNVPKLINEIADAEIPEIITSKSIDVAASGHKDDQGLNRIRKMKEASDIVAKGYAMPVVEIDMPKDDGHISDLDSIGWDESNHEAFDNNMTEEMVQSRHNASQLEISTGKLHHRKARKVRLLDDIMRSEELCSFKKVHILYGDAEAIENDCDKKQDASKGRPQNQDHESHLVDRRTKVNPSKRKNRNDAIRKEDEEHPLMHWLKKVPKKANTHNGDAETDSNASPVGISKFSVDESNGKDLDLQHEDCEARGHKQKITAGRNRNMKPPVKAGQSPPMLQQDIITEKGHNLEDLPSETLHHKAFHSKSTEVRITEKDLRHVRNIQDHNRRDDVLSNKKHMTYQAEHGETYRMHRSKDSFGMHEHVGTQVLGKVIKKRRTMRAWEQETIDDIPMDIVELLAKNLHERRSMSAELATKNMHNFSQMTGNMKDGYIMDVTKCHGNKVFESSKMSHKKLTQQNSESNIMRNSVWATVKCNDKADCRLKACNSTSIDKQNRHIDLKQQELICASTKFLAVSQCSGLPMNGSQLPVIDNYRNSFPQNFCRDRRMLQPSGSHKINQTISGQNSCRKAHDGSSVVLNGTPCGIDGHKVDANFNRANMDANDKYFGKNLETVARKTDRQRSINSADKRFPNSKGKAESSVNQGTGEAAASFMEAGRHRLEMTGPADLYTNETISALSLLRLMDRAVWSGEPHHASSDLNRTGSIQEPESYSNDRRNEFVGLKVRARSKETHKHSPTIRNPDHDQLQGSSCQPLRPLPQTGIHGSPLQKETMTRSHNFGTPLRFKDGHSNGVASFKINGKEKTPVSHSAIHTRSLNTQTSISRTRNDRGQVGFNGAVQHLMSNHPIENCVLNKNPAEFMMPDY